ncbi:MAG: hypothetical protein EPN89_11915 [Methylovulum sp.]|nr:MAG: hypothetical protein EPN89_11915 [Methylovulum sp.]
MNENNYTPADEKALAMYYAYAALVKTLSDSGHLQMDDLFKNLAGATQQLGSIGETGAAAFLGAMSENLTSI